MKENTSNTAKKHFNLFNISKLIVSLIMLVLFASCTPVKKDNATKRPNIIIIVADDLGWKDIGYHGSEINTPALDKMATEGIIFDRFYVHTVCSPTRASILTGRFPSRYGIDAPSGDEQALPTGTLTLAGLLKQNGYETAISGKWHLGTVPEARPLNYGFDSSYGYLRGQIDPYTHLYKFGDKTWHRNDSLVDEEGHATDLITNEAVRVIQKKRDRDNPFFLYVAYSVPHYPLDEPQEWLDKYKNSIQNKSRRKFAAAVSHMDDGIGKIMAALKRKNIDKNTIILFLSDNGAQEKWYSATQYGGKFEAHDVLGNNLPLRDWKASPYDGALRVPAFFYWPDSISNSICFTHINAADVYPTLAYLAGAKLPDGLNLDGINVWSAINGDKLPDNRIMYWRRPHWVAVKKGDWKLIHYDDRTGVKQEELYNIDIDPYEKNDVAAENPEKAKELREELEKQMALDKAKINE